LRKRGRETLYRLTLESERLIDIEMMIRILESMDAVFVSKLMLALLAHQQLLKDGSLFSPVLQ
jgi:hypothetical protein